MSHENKKQITRVGVYGVCLENGKILLIRQKNGPYKDRFDFPGGGIEFGESIEGALQREFLEEIAMEFDSLTHIANLTATVDVLSPSNDTYTLFQIGMLYQVQGYRIVNDQQQGSLERVWIDLKDVSENECSKLLWKYRGLLFL